MRLTVILVVAGIAAVLSGFIFMRARYSSGTLQQPTTESLAVAEPEQPAPASVRPLAPRAASVTVPAQPTPAPPVPTPLNKAERLAQIRENFRALAAGDPATALRAARQLQGNERETALLALVTEWTHGELTSPQQRAWAISNFGMEAGLGLELARNPQLAAVWAKEMTEGAGRAVVLAHAAVGSLSQPAAAFALGENLTGEDRQRFMDSVFSGWAQRDTEAALQWANQLSDAGERDAAIKAIQTEAPVGIGTLLSMKDGYPVIRQVLPGAPAEAGGQIRPGDRIVALAQGDNAFVDAHGLPLTEVVAAMRGAPGTLLQLQVVSADARPDSAPRIVSVMRGQIMLKQ